MDPSAYCNSIVDQHIVSHIEPFTNIYFNFYLVLIKPKEASTSININTSCEINVSCLHWFRSIEEDNTFHCIYNFMFIYNIQSSLQCACL